MKLHNVQSAIARSRARYKVWRAGRRTGKTIYAGEEIKATAILEKDARVLYVATTQGQARDIMWRHIKKEFVAVNAKTNESLLEIETPNKHGTKSLIKLTGWESIERVRGQSFDLIILDELDSLAGFLETFQEVIKPLVLDRLGKIIFLGTPKDSNPNLRSLEDMYGKDEEWGFFHATSYDNPFLSGKEIDKEKEALSAQSFRQEWLAEYGDGSTTLFDPIAVSDMFTIILKKTDDTPYLVIDPAGQGEDTTAVGMWRGLEVHLSQNKNLSSDDIEDSILKLEAQHQIPRANIMIDGIGLGDSIGDRVRLNGCSVFKGSFSPVPTDIDLSKLVQTNTRQLAPTKSDFLNLRAQTYFALSRAISERRVRVHCSVDQMEKIKRELNATVEMEGKGKTQIISKEDIKRIVGHSPDLSDVLAMRMFYEIKEKVMPISHIPQELLNRQWDRSYAIKKNRGINSSI